MAKLNINFNDKNYEIDESALAAASAALKTHLSTVMNGTGATINFGGVAYSIDSAKLDVAGNLFADYLDEASGEPEVVTYYTYEDIEASGGLLMPCGATDPMYVVASVSPDFSTVTLTKNGDDSDGLMTDLPSGYVAETGLPLTTVVIENGVKNIGAYFVTRCATITNVVIPDSVTTIGNDAFCNCTGLTSVVIPDSVTSIGEVAFAYCTGLTSVVIPDSVTSIGYLSFNNCSALTDITFEGTIAQWNAITKGTNWNSEVPATHVTCSDGTVAL